MLQAAQQWAGVHISCELMGLSDRVRNLVFTNLDFSQQMCAAFIEYTIAIRASEVGFKSLFEYTSFMRRSRVS
ncbi:hypothetical protein B9Z55_027781 [Caenorhabditis nigoni]|uniref:Uncharacterized protein n=1 Tax=Caenorhabditis nigoni TaxID=1611254 RepID=A0A2G5SE79_9PELO|nr:hypothetical protein B9Z55_027781 [Caenorhabditis nigoni]